MSTVSGLFNPESRDCSAAIAVKSRQLSRHN